MFDIGFTELLLVAVVGLLVIGPEQLPGAIRNTSQGLSKIKKGLADFKSELEQEIGVDEMQSQLRKDSIVADFKTHAEQLEAIDPGISSTNLDLLNSFSYSGEKPVAGDNP